ncbi:phosphatidylglycerol lysyltransferase [Enterococcus moraviensis ATCC BAA-383]|uniref:Phosphatidylglycerol lysyltransferase n=1 Tax=Enterococcus moraviensis ATCC BAA-383 TaxID=1158609 RepID=R2SSN9_9ENTE|nr:bifunctional lysylphosphatidylglycerol flippase/synthetase MprF [Enterococcus moraviensis]EOH95816.1 phosphatidylglycerol lysyltransferase [Enterococcus moraviensis ATCC BAA-383]EOT66303.1 phosphatidylglycerol lysyltransferase [Enterococcus moraviensis ATCC BAA-383]OJG67633.1 phosphatidylglycerol lysyltransferase [Enterococcus moraviensis]
MKSKINQLIHWMKEHNLLLKLIFLGSVLIFVANQVTHIVQGMTWQDVFHTMGQQNRFRIIGMVLAGLIGVLPMILYDLVVVRVLEEQGKAKMNRWDWFVSAWVTNTINNLAGFGGVVGATLRANFYGKDVPRKKVVATVSKVALFMISGLSILSFIAFIDVFFIRPDSLFREYWVWLLAGSLIAPALLLFTQLKKYTLFKDFFPRGIFLLFGASLGQWLGAMFVFLSVGALMKVDVSLLSVYPMFVIATLIGMLTMVPGGMGTFDVLMILGLSQLGVGQSTAVVWLIYYRLFYYVLPFITGIILFIHQTGIKINRFLDNLPRMFSQKVAHFILVAALYFAGIMMVLLSTITNLSNVSRLFKFLLPFSFDFLDQTFNMLIGFLLLGLARGISMKVKKAYWPTIGLMIFGILNTISRTASWQLILVYLVILSAVFLARKEFYREKFVYSWGALAVDGVLFSFLFIIYAVAGYYSSHPDKTGPLPHMFLLFPSDDVWFSGLLGLGISMIGLITLYQYLADTSKQLGETYQEPRLTALIANYGGTQSSQLLYLKNYSYYYYQENDVDEVLFAYQIKANKCFLLADPIGNKDKWAEATLAFMDAADLLGYQAAFYRISEAYTMVLHDLGFNFMKVGEEGIVDFTRMDATPISFATNSMELKHLSNLGYTFTMYHEPVSDELFQSLARVSEEWLGSQRERNFVGGCFNKEYLALSDIGILRNVDHEVIGFITAKPIVQNQRMSYDLLRYSDKAPEHVTDFLLTHFIAEYQNRGYTSIDLGTAPLSNVGETKYSFLNERLINIFYKYGDQAYGFKDTRKEKERYVTNWESRYFAYSKQSNTLFAFIQLALLIERGKGKAASIVEEVMIGE